MSNDDEITTKQMRSAMVIIGLFLASVYMSITEIRFWISGVDQEVIIYATYDSKSMSRRNSKPVVGAKFVVIDAEKAPHESALEFPESWSPPDDKKLWITYLPGHESTHVRLRGERHWLWPIIFFVMIGVVAIKGWMIWQEVSADTEKDRRSRGR